MRKLLLFTMFASLLALNPVLADTSVNVQQPGFKKHLAVKQQREMAFEKRLGLSDEQKIKAREIRERGHEKLRPVIEEIKSKKQEEKMIKMSRMAVQMQEEKLEVIDKELRLLEKRAHDIRKDNMKEFESILTRQQKKTLKDMKKEGRKRYHSEHPAQMQFKFQAPNMKK